jgi:hypothetical protein
MTREPFVPLTTNALSFWPAKIAPEARIGSELRRLRFRVDSEAARFVTFVVPVAMTAPPWP